MRYVQRAGARVGNRWDERKSDIWGGKTAPVQRAGRNLAFSSRKRGSTLVM